LKHIKVYIVTWKRNDVLDDLLHDLFERTTFKDYDNCEVNIINNHSGLEVNDKFKDKVKIHHNMCRVDWSTGNLSADFNFALVHGFVDLKNPDAELVVTMQNDAVLDENWADCIVEQMKKYEFLVGYLGDNVVTYRPEHVIKTGLWDENYASVYHKESDYYLRSLIYNKDKCSINDLLHRRLHNYNPELTIDLIGERGFTITENGSSRWMESEQHQLLRDEQNYTKPFVDYYWKWKWEGTHSLPMVKGDWNQGGWLINWPDSLISDLPTAPKVPQFVKYPFFEKDVEDLVGKGFVTDGKMTR
jgi:hypothetical protein|tara:strand:+ start:14303 stop:15208 length:906 start_codon:yes stop_codon:yes gene_type:complete